VLTILSVSMFPQMAVLAGFFEVMRSGSTFSGSPNANWPLFEK
jgi:hypothetical protein